MQTPPRIFSGMQPTGELHIGNYFGALRQWVALAKAGNHQSIFCIVDAHAVTVDFEPREMPGLIFNVALTYLAAGLDTEQAIIFVQSDVHEQAELSWYLSTVTPIGDLYRMTQFKEKSEEHKQGVNAGLLTYPVLMAADILAYRATIVPVGNDQVQHLELTREISRKFNARYGQVFPEPTPQLSRTPRIMGLDGKTKMSKSRGNSISIFEAPASIEKKLKGAFTDPNKLRKGDPGNPDICNIYTVHGAVTESEKVREISENCRSGALGCSECKKTLIEGLVRELDPIRSKAEELRQDPGRVVQVLENGAERARAIAQDTLRDVREAMGLGCPRDYPKSPSFL